MNSTIILRSPSGMRMDIDYENKTIYFPRESGTELQLGFIPMEINFSDITAIELRKPKLLLAGGCNIIVNNTRYMTANLKNDMTCFITKDFIALQNALSRVLQMCGLSDFKNFNSVNAKKVVYSNENASNSSERIKKCKICGHVFCYSAADIAKNASLELSAGFSRISQMGNALGGTSIGASLHESNANSYEARIMDFDVCPKCNSRELVRITREEYEAEMKAANAPAVVPAPVASAADELKKFKDLLDAGIITQEEFDAKKKQLLGL